MDWAEDGLGRCGKGETLWKRYCEDAEEEGPVDLSCANISQRLGKYVRYA